jgi:beta-glucosidase
LKNDGALLPISPAKVKRIAIVGEGASVPVIQGSGCATTPPTSVDVPLDEIRKLAGADIQIDVFQGTSGIVEEREALIAQAETGAAGADIVIVFVNVESGYDGEGSDRRTLDLAPGHDELVERLAAANPNLVVVIASPDAVVMPWIDKVPAVVETFFSGQAMGGGLADVLFGRVNPCGKLTTTFPKRMEDMPTYLTYPGENGRHVYSEGIHVGYRWYDARDIEPLFPFGFGLSFTEFAYSDLSLDRSEIRRGERVCASFTVTNTGAVEGKETCQLYARYGKPRLKRPIRELKGFRKVALRPGESRRITIELTAQELCAFDPMHGDWTLDSDTIAIEIGASSRDIRLAADLRTVSAVSEHRRIERDTQPVFVLQNSHARRKFIVFLQGQLGISAQEADTMLEHCANSFVGIFTTFDRRFRQRFPQADIERLLREMNGEDGRDDQAA